jgi:ABC-2 type transport system permease protein
MADSLHVARKEFAGFLASPAAFLFLALFLLATLFIFFWVETFFARNIADVRPLFQWMPLLLIFLVAALTMRMWSEERRAGTLESLLTSPVDPMALVLGKYLAGLALTALALALTLPLPLSVSLIGEIDWGPVAGGYVASLFLASAYLGVGLFLSARTDNPIVALILTTTLCGLLYLIGSDRLTSLFDYGIARWLELLGSGSRFDSITRGVLDLRDLWYYISLTGLFLALNRLTLEQIRRAGNQLTAGQRRWQLVTALLIANLLLANLWLAPFSAGRVDLTEGDRYSLSPATGHYLQQLREPLLIRGYFSARTHPLLAPLVPQIEDLLEEYAEAGGDRVRVEIVDPHNDPQIEEEAASRYAIRPVPFQTSSRYQSAVVNSYFDLLIAYGDQYQTLGFRDLIEVKLRSEQELEVALNNPEYVITRTIRKVIDAWRAGGNPLDSIGGQVRFDGYISPPERLPAVLAELRSELTGVLREIEGNSDGRFVWSLSDPDSGAGELAQELSDRYGFRPQVAGLFDRQTFWFYMVLGSGNDTVQIPLPLELNRTELKRSLDAALMRLAPGFLKTIAIAGGETGYSLLREQLAEGARLVDADLSSGRIPAESDLLLVLSPEGVDEKGRFAIDQFLMQGGSVVIATAPFAVDIGRSLKARPLTSGLEEWLLHHGISIDSAMILDRNSAALPIPVERYVGPIAVQEIRMLPYPHFPDLRDGLNRDHPITAALDELTLNWASPLDSTAATAAGLRVTPLMTSSEQSWRSDSLDVVPDFRRYPQDGFAVEGGRGQAVAALLVEGSFESWFKGRESPLIADQSAESGEQGEAAEGELEEGEPLISGVIDRSPDGARLLLIASNAFASDSSLQLASQGLGTEYLRPLELIENAIEWSLEDPELLAIRGRSQLARTLAPLSHDSQLLLEYGNYGLALFGLFLVWVWRRHRRQLALRHYQLILKEV